MRVLVTGVTGFVGGHLAELLAAEGGHTLYGLSRSGAWPAGLAHLAGQVELHAADVLDAAALDRVLAAARPDWVFHLAGYANTGKSFKEPDACWRDNLGGTQALYGAIRRSGLAPRVVFASTGLVYGDPDPPGEPVPESAELRPASPYAASKAAADLLSYQAFKSDGLHVVRARPFTQTGPRQAADYAIANFARQIAAAERGDMAPVIRTGDLSARRDYLDVRDVVAAFRLLVERGAPGEAYNVGRGRAVRIADALGMLVASAKVPVEVVSQADPARAGDTAVTMADPRKLRAATGWEARRTLESTLADVLAAWR